jgi:hypothetical protein
MLVQDTNSVACSTRIVFVRSSGRLSISHKLDHSLIGEILRRKNYL